MSLFTLCCGCCEQMDEVVEVRDSALMVAVQQRNFQTVKTLIEHGADTEDMNNKEETPLLVAVQQGCLDIVALLLDHGANKQAVDKSDNNALYMATMGCHLHMAQLLLQRGVNVNTVNKSYNTSLKIAVNSRNEEMVKLLLQHGADCNMTTHPRNPTLLQLAIERERNSIVKMLLDAGANPFQNTTDNRSLLSLTTDPTMERLIREYRRVDGPSWLVRELSKCELEWNMVCSVQDKVKKVHITSRESLARIPSTLFTHAYLEAIGIDILTVRCALLEIHRTSQSIRTESALSRAIPSNRSISQQQHRQVQAPRQQARGQTTFRAPRIPIVSSPNSLPQHHPSRSRASRWIATADWTDVDPEYWNTNELYRLPEDDLEEVIDDDRDMMQEQGVEYEQTLY